ncbi:hypothetical protein N0V90_002708 [Kalmusia sp. IMI 367209]|nr:hypothetical protein N0V90_002708 [Kalmusia sp. IMI 367209]
MAAGNTTGIKDELNLCTAPTNATDFAILESMLTTGPSEPRNSIFHLHPQPLRIANSTSPLTPLKVYTSIAWVSANPARPECYDWAAGGSAAVGRAGVAELPFNYTTCTYFPLNCFVTRSETIFPPSSSAELSDEVQAARCKPYGCPHQFTPSELEQRYGYTQGHLARMTNIIFPLGQYDPITGFAVQDFALSGDRSAPRRLYVSDMAHTQDLMAYNSLDPQPVLDVSKGRDWRFPKFWWALLILE